MPVLPAASDESLTGTLTEREITGGKSLAADAPAQLGAHAVRIWEECRKAFELSRQGKKLSDVAAELHIPIVKVADRVCFYSALAFWWDSAYHPIVPVADLEELKRLVREVLLLQVDVIRSVKDRVAAGESEAMATVIRMAGVADVYRKIIADQATLYGLRKASVTDVKEHARRFMRSTSEQDLLSPAAMERVQELAQEKKPEAA